MVSATCYGRQLGQYLVVFDERIDPSKSSLKRREPIRGLFCDIEEYLRAVDDSLPLLGEPNCQTADSSSG